MTWSGLFEYSTNLEIPHYRLIIDIANMNGTFVVGEANMTYIATFLVYIYCENSQDSIVIQFGQYSFISVASPARLPAVSLRVRNPRQTV